MVAEIPPRNSFLGVKEQSPKKNHENVLVKGVEGEDSPLATSVLTKPVREQTAPGRQRAGSAGNET